jgi:hypothetical protein
MNKEPEDFERPGCYNVQESGMDKKVCSGCTRRLECMLYPDRRVIWLIQKRIEKVLDSTTLPNLNKVHDILYECAKERMISGWSDLKVEKKSDGILEVNVKIRPILPVDYVLVTVGKLP